MANQALRLTGRGGTDGAAPASDELNLRELWRAIARRKWLLLATIVLITGSVAAWVNQQTPLYAAETLIHIKAREAQIIQIEGVVEEMVADGATIESEIELLSSRGFMRRIVERLGLMADPEFNTSLREDSESLFDWLDPQRYLPIDEWLEALFPAQGDGQPNPLASLDRETRVLNNVVGRLSGRVRVKQIGRSYVVAVQVTSEDPVKASEIANAIGDEYLSVQVETKYAAAERASRWLSERVSELRGEVLEAEAKIAEYRSQNNLVDAGSQPVLIQMTQLNTQVALSQAQRAEAEARLSQARSVLGTAGRGVEAAAKVLDSPLMASLRTQETELLRKMSDLSAEYGARHPQMVNLQAERQSVHEKMNDEVERIIQELENDVAVTRARERELQNSLAELHGQFSTVDMASVELHNLTREAETNRQLFENFLTRFREIVEQQELQEPDARVLSPADPPARPSYPRTTTVTLLAFAGSVVLGILLIFVVERWDANFGFRSADEIQSELGLRAMGLVPDLSRRDTQGIMAEDYVLEKPNSAFAEALQRIRTNLFLSEDGQPPKSVLITSSVPLEGKSAIAASLARQSARSGLKVILIDADMRRPRLHEVIGVANQNGLSEVLTGRANPETAIRRDEKSGLDFLPAGVGVVSPPDLFRSSTMRVLLEEITGYYDLVIIDSPPVAAVSDSFTLSGMVDKAIYVIRWEQTPRNVALAGIRQMVEAGADIAGIVLSRVDVKKHARYGYADSGYYQGSYRKYYVN